MAKLNARIVFIAVVLFLVLGATPALACMCPGYVRGSVEDEVNAAVEGSSAVFVGKVIGYEFRKGVLFEMPGAVRPSDEQAKSLETQLIRFEVERWWNIELPSEILLITSPTREIKVNDPPPPPVSGNIVQLPLPDRDFIWNMCMVPFGKDQSYLVYASGKADKLQYRYCTRTTTVSRATEDLAILGEGRKPAPAKPKQN